MKTENKKTIGAQLMNSNARKDPSKKLSHQLTIYITEASRNSWLKLASESGLTMNKLITCKMNGKPLPKKKSKLLIDNIL